MKITYLLAASLLPLSLISFSVFGHSEHGRSPEDAADYRAAVMETMAWNMGTMKDMLKNENHFDTAGFKRRADTIIFLSQLVEEGFKLGKAGEDAKPEIWDNWEDFTAQIQALTDASAQLALDAEKPGQSPENLAASLEKTADACSSCHKQYKKR